MTRREKLEEMRDSAYALYMRTNNDDVEMLARIIERLIDELLEAPKLAQK